MNRLPEQDNNFDFLRLAMALGVLVSHQYSVAGVQPPSIQGLFYLGTSGVLGFFAISGYLVMGSWSNDPNIFRFAARRVLRMFPGLLVMTLLVVLGLGRWSPPTPWISIFLRLPPGGTFRCFDSGVLRKTCLVFS